MLDRARAGEEVDDGAGGEGDGGSDDALLIEIKDEDEGDEDAEDRDDEAGGAEALIEFAQARDGEAGDEVGRESCDGGEEDEFAE